MFIWDFVVDTVFEDIIEWFYGQLVGFLGAFFGMMGNMGAEIFEWLPLNVPLNIRQAAAV